MRHTLRPHERVRRRPEFLHAYEHGRKHHGRYMTVFASASTAPAARLGVSATRKFGPAVARNRAKRRARDLFRHHKPMPGVDLVVIPRRGFGTVGHADLVADYLSALRRLKVTLLPQTDVPA
ncbi:ribonuclease P protein component [Luteitalea sp.]|jgi:ribonuclease P protein component|uniref:ribonuclease P protein component n=1 Tax=Luteitalea sp. TaxID=2004800 RepID=UPI0037CA915F